MILGYFLHFFKKEWNRIYSFYYKIYCIGMYDKKGYKRRQKWIVIRPISYEETTVLNAIMDRWNIDLRRAKRLIRDNTLTEILEGELDDYGFTPWPRLSIKWAIIIAFLLSFIIFYKTNAFEPVTAFIPNDHIIWDNVSK